MNHFIFYSASLVLVIWGFYLYKILITLRRFPEPRFPAKPPARWPSVSILVPARNEEKNIARCLKSLLELDYPHYEIIVINDRSTDRTAEVVDTIKNHHPAKLQALHLSESVHGWSGKNYALHQGVQKAKGEWFLFTDADTVHSKSGLKISLTAARSRSIGFLTLLSRMECVSLPEKMIQPIAGGLMTLWYPIEKLNDPQSPLGFANGQYILMDRPTYRAIGGHEAVKAKLLEDVALSERAKKLKIPFRIEVGIDIVKTRMYQGFYSSWNGWKRIFMHLKKDRPRELLFSWCELFVIGILPLLLFLGACFGSVQLELRLYTGIIYTFSVFVRWFLDLKGKMPGWTAFFYPLSTILVLGIVWNAWWDIVRGKRTTWRGAHY